LHTSSRTTLAGAQNPGGRDSRPQERRPLDNRRVARPASARNPDGPADLNEVTPFWFEKVLVAIRRQVWCRPQSSHLVRIQIKVNPFHSAKLRQGLLNSLVCVDMDCALQPALMC